MNRAKFLIPTILSLRIITPKCEEKKPNFFSYSSQFCSNVTEYKKQRQIDFEKFLENELEEIIYKAGQASLKGYDRLFIPVKMRINNVILNNEELNSFFDLMVKKLESKGIKTENKHYYIDNKLHILIFW